MTRAQPLNVADKLDEARALIERGWIKHLFHDCGGYCAVGAVSQITDGTYYADVAKGEGFHEMVGALAATVDVRSDWMSLSDWNDAPERTQAEVVEAFKKAAELARAEA